MNIDEQIVEAHNFYKLMSERRSVREFLAEDVPIELITECVKAAGTAPSGANVQPWYFAIVRDKALKKEIRIAAEKEEFEFYTNRADDRFLRDLSPFNLSWKKQHLEDASTLIVIFAKAYEGEHEDKKRAYYPNESVGIATGILITALHKLGLSTLTHTPNPMKFLTKILNRPKGERPFLILATGYKLESYKAPDITRKSLESISDIY